MVKKRAVKRKTPTKRRKTTLHASGAKRKPALKSRSKYMLKSAHDPYKR